MVSELIEKIPGVGALVVDSSSPESGFLTIEEYRHKRSSGKLVGMRSLPMETLEADETHQQGLERLFKEEVKLTNLPTSLTRLKLCRCELTPGVVLHSYLIDLAAGSSIEPGTELTEIGSIRWTSFSEVFQAEGSLKFRPGVFEILTSYLNFKASPEQFNPEIYTNLRDRVPDEIFDLLDQGFSQTEALSRFGLFPGSLDQGYLLPAH